MLYVSINRLSYKVYKVPMTKESVLTQEQVDLLFPSLEELILYHSESYSCVCMCIWGIVFCFEYSADLCTELKEHTADTTNGVVKAIADVLLQRVSHDMYGYIYLYNTITV